MNEYFKTNQALWDQKTNYHRDSEFYDLERFKAGKTSLKEIELDALQNEVAGKSLLHLQCHFGQDTLSWARMGAKVTGIDLSTKSIELARELATELDIDAQFVQSNLYDLPNNLDGQYDIVFTSYGTITWLPDLKKWASIINHFLKPGGIFYIAEFHPSFYMFDTETHQASYEYFNCGKPYMEEMEGTYADTNAPIKHKEYFWTHSLAEVISSLLSEGLTLVDFQEFPFSPYDCMPNMEEVEKDRFVYTNPKITLPHVFSVKVKKPI